MGLKRILEPELMETRRDALEYEAIDHEKANAEFADYLATELRFAGGRLLDLGTGPGDLPVAVCRRLKNARVTAVDLSPVMRALAAKKIARSGLSGRIRLLRADVKATKLPSGSFDLVICSNLVHHLPDPVLLFREIGRLCRPGGGFLIRDLRRPATLKALNALMLGAAGDTPRQLELLRNSLRAALRTAEAGFYAKKAGLENFTLRSVGNRHWQLERPVTER
ncbi:MAG TPA: class I SAM-dependent methyltransferase [Elusimicrobiales bacterium]|nr:class I SAM-dependent methyltransferase [Elusimicrobiales bacterium]